MSDEKLSGCVSTGCGRTQLELELSPDRAVLRYYSRWMGDAQPSPRSALLISGEARYQWRHAIRGRLSDHGRKRARRVSLTFRNVILEPA
jgi:hypothetical protein